MVATSSLLGDVVKPTKLADLSPDNLRELQTELARLGYYPSTEIDGIYGKKTKEAWKAFKHDRFLNEPSLIGQSSVKTLLEAVPLVLVSLEKFNQCFKRSTKKDRDNYFIPINQALREFQINTSRRIACFFAQIAHESGNLRYSEEIASGEAYEGRKDLGNIRPGDGKRFKGRGLIQLTGRANYYSYGKALNLNLIEYPELAKSAYVSARIAGLYWQSNGLNELADKMDFTKITRRINGGTNGLKDRLSHLAHMKSVLGISLRD
jgi:putative chitinase